MLVLHIPLRVTRPISGGQLSPAAMGAKGWYRIRPDSHGVALRGIFMAYSVALVRFLRET